MRIQYRGKQLGWRIYLRKGAIQIDIGGKSPRKGHKVFGVSLWDTLKQAYIYSEQYLIENVPFVASGIDYFEENKHVNSEMFYVNPRLIQEGCNDEFTCNAVKTYLKREKQK